MAFNFKKGTKAPQGAFHTKYFFVPIMQDVGQWNERKVERFWDHKKLNFLLTWVLCNTQSTAEYVNAMIKDVYVYIEKQ